MFSTWQFRQSYKHKHFDMGYLQVFATLEESLPESPAEAPGTAAALSGQSGGCPQGPAAGVQLACHEQKGCLATLIGGRRDPSPAQMPVHLQARLSRACAVTTVSDLLQ